MEIGTNILVKDNGIRGIVLKVDMQNINIEQDKSDVEMQVFADKVAEEDEKYYYDNQVIVEVEAGVKLGVLARKLLDEGIEGFEFASRNSWNYWWGN